jgi:hypothetical protein
MREAEASGGEGTCGFDHVRRCIVTGRAGAEPYSLLSRAKDRHLKGLPLRILIFARQREIGDKFIMRGGYVPLHYDAMRTI